MLVESRRRGDASLTIVLCLLKTSHCSIINPVYIMGYLLDCSVVSSCFRRREPFLGGDRLPSRLGMCSGVVLRLSRPRMDPEEATDAFRAGAELGLVSRSITSFRPNRAFQLKLLAAVSLRSLSSLRLSKADRCFSYPSRNGLEIREENMSSPRGFDAGGMGFSGCEADADGDRERDRMASDDGRLDTGDAGDERRSQDITGIEKRAVNGGFRTFKYMLKDRSARLA